MPPLADCSGPSSGDATANGTASKPATPASAKTLRTCMEAPLVGCLHRASPRERSLERALWSLERAELVSLRFCSVAGGGDAHVAPEEAREMTLVGEAGIRGDRGEGRIAAGDLG